LKAENIVESEIVALLKEGNECPVCRSMEKAVDGWVIGAFSNLLHNENARLEMKRDGFCADHLRRITQLAREKSDVGSLAVSIVFRELLIEQLAWLRVRREPVFRTKRKPGPGSCVLCSVANQTERIYLSAFSRFLQSLEVRKTYEESGSIFCINHSRYLLKKVGQSTQEWFADIQKRKYAQLTGKIEEFVSKHDYRNKVPIGEERTAWLTASKLIGERESGNDVG
jgi:hypothetical protein